MKHITGSLAVLAIALSFSYADTGDARIMKSLHQETSTGVVAECQLLQSTTRDSIKLLETSIKTAVKDFKKNHPESLISYLEVSNSDNMKKFVAAKKSLHEDEQKLRNDFANAYSATGNLKLKDEYSNTLVALEQAFYDSLISLVKTDKKDAYTIFVKDAMAVATKNKALRMEIIMKRIDMMLKCWQGRHDKVVQLIDKVMSSDMSAKKKQQFLERTTKRMEDMKKKLAKKAEKRNGSAFERSKDDKEEMINDVLESAARASSELEDEKSRE